MSTLKTHQFSYIGSTTHHATSDPRHQVPQLHQSLRYRLVPTSAHRTPTHPTTPARGTYGSHPQPPVAHGTVSHHSQQRMEPQSPTVWNHSRLQPQHVQPHSSFLTRGKGGCRGCRGYCACCPCCPTHADCAAPGLPLPPSSHNRMPPHAATRHQHTTPTPRQVRAGHYRCCSRRRRWGVPYVSVCVMPDVPAVDKGGTGNSGSGMPKPTGVVGHSGLL